MTAAAGIRRIIKERSISRSREKKRKKEKRKDEMHFSRYYKLLFIINLLGYDDDSRVLN